MVGTSGVVESARRGDAFAFQTLVDRYQAAIYRYVYRLTADTALARDLTTRTFLTAHKRLKKTGPDLRFDTWLYALASASARRSLWLRDLSLRLHLPRQNAHGQRAADDDQETTVTQDALMRLSVGQRICLLLATQAGFSYDDIADLLHVPVGTVRGRLAQARGRLAELLGGTIAQPSSTECQQVRPLLSSYLDRRLSGEENSVVRRHLDACASCTAVLTQYQDIDRRIARLRQRGAAPALTSDIMTVVRGGTLPAVQRGHRRTALIALSGALVMGMVSIALVLAAAGKPPATTAGGLLYIGLANSTGELSVVDVQSAKYVTTIYLGSRPQRLVATRDGTTVYVLTENGIVTRVNALRHTVEERYALSGRIGGMALSTDETTLFLTLTDRRAVVLVDATAGKQIGEVRVGRSPREVITTPDGQWLLVYNSADNTLSKVRLATREEVRVYRLLRRGDAVSEFSLHPMVSSPDSRSVFVSELNRERIWVVDLVSDAVEAVDVPLRDFSRDIAVSPAGDRLYVTHGDPRGTRAAWAGLASMVLPKVEREAEMRGYFHGVAVSPDGTYVFGTNPDENTVVLADARTLHTVATVAVGQRPTVLVYVPRPVTKG